jgi:hypothetical protein
MHLLLPLFYCDFATFVVYCFTVYFFAGFAISSFTV